MTLIIFSKNRAMQVDLLLRSMEEYYAGTYKVCLLYKAEGKFKEGYQLLQRKYPSVLFIEEQNFKQDLINIIQKNVIDYFIPLVDDNVFISKLTDEMIDRVINLKKKYPNIYTCSLRMNPGINYCFPAKKEIKPSSFKFEEDMFIWDWTVCDLNYCWGYPFPVESTIYEKDHFLLLIKDLNFYHPNSLESGLLGKRNKSQNLMCAYKRTIIWNIQDNFVRDNQSNQRAQELESMFLRGQTIKVPEVSNPLAVHGKIDYSFFEGPPPPRRT